MRKRTRTFTVEATSRTTSDKASVMSQLLDPVTWPGWQPEIIVSKGPSPLGPGDVVTGSARMLGFTGVAGRSVAVDVRDDHFEEDVVVGIGLRIRYQVTTDARGTLVTHRLESDMPTGFAGRVLSFLLRRRLKRLQRTALARLLAQAEVQAGVAARSST